jgi:hypothetical protein
VSREGSSNLVEIGRQELDSVFKSLTLLRLSSALVEVHRSSLLREIVTIERVFWRDSVL